jgi:hypothetical protein
MSNEDPPPPTLWEIRLVEFFPTPPLVTGALLIGALTGLAFLYHAFVLGEPVLLSDPEGVFPFTAGPRNALLSAMLLGYTLASLSYGKTEFERDLSNLDPTAGELPGAISHQVLVASRFRGAAGVVGLFLFNLAMQLHFGSVEAGGSGVGWAWLRDFAPHLLYQLILGWAIGRVIYFVSQPNPELDAATRDRPVDLLDLRPFLLIGRVAVRHGLMAIVGTSLMIPWIFVPMLSPVFVVMVLLGATASLLAPLFPLRWARRRIGDAKRVALAELDAELRSLRDAESPGDARPAGRMADLLAYRSYVESIREWPFDSSTLVRLGLYLLIPVASWVGSAFVERMVDTALE